MHPHNFSDTHGIFLLYNLLLDNSHKEIIKWKGTAILWKKMWGFSWLLTSTSSYSSHFYVYCSAWIYGPCEHGCRQYPPLGASSTMMGLVGASFCSRMFLLTPTYFSRLVRHTGGTVTQLYSNPPPRGDGGVGG